MKLELTMLSTASGTGHTCGAVPGKIMAEARKCSVCFPLLSCKGGCFGLFLPSVIFVSLAGGAAFSN